MPGDVFGSAELLSEAQVAAARDRHARLGSTSCLDHLDRLLGWLARPAGSDQAGRTTV